MVARMLVRMISTVCNLIKRYYNIVDCPPWALMMLMILIVKFTLLSLTTDIKPW